MCIFTGICLDTGLCKKEVRSVQDGLQARMDELGFRFSCPPDKFALFFKKIRYHVDPVSGITRIFDTLREYVVSYYLRALCKIFGINMDTNITAITSVLLASYLLQTDLTRNTTQRDQPFIISVFNRVFSYLSPGREKKSEPRGGMTLPCVRGEHVGVVSVDVDSMYPSIMLNENTIKVLKESHRVRGFLQRGLEVKSAVSHVPYMRKLSKHILNSFYGAMRCPAFIGYNPEVAEETCAYGRKFILDMHRVAEEHGGRVVYGVTDSLFVTGMEGNTLLDVMHQNFLPYKFSHDVISRMVIVNNNHYVSMSSEGEVTHRGTLSRRKGTTVQLKEIFNDLVGLALRNDFNGNMLFEMVETLNTASATLSTEDRNELRSNLVQIFQYTGNGSLAALV